MAVSTRDEHKWWKEAVVYQIYPASFKSTGAGDTPGWGDIRGITSKLDYLKDLGVDIVWTSPMYKSPQVDMGYDIADYEDMDPKYGTLADIDELIAGLKDRGMKLMMDLVVNHTSDQHAWFLDARSSKSSTHRDWYIWKPARYDKDGKRQPPNNWAQILGEANSAWTWDEKTQEYFLSLFTPEQPDLNWENPDVRAAVHNVLRFWLDRGASGFRMDVINLISKVQTFPDAEIFDANAKYQPGNKFFANGPRLHEFLREMNDKVLSKYDTITVGEMPFVQDEDEVLRVVARERKELNMIFIFELVDLSNAVGAPRLSLRPWKVKELRNVVSKWQKAMRERGGWNSIFDSNHDNPRPVSQFTDDSDQYRELSAKLLAMMETTLSGTLYVYQGEELGMINVPPDWAPSEYKDIESQNYWKKMNDLYPGDEEKLRYAREVLQKKARDHARTPVQWSDEPNAGFCEANVTPWMRIHDNYKSVNAAAQLHSTGDELSVFHFWQRGLANRKKHKKAFVYGSYESLDESDNSVFAYKRSDGAQEAFVVVLNFSGETIEWNVPKAVTVHKWVTSNYTGDVPQESSSGKVSLRAWEALLGTAAP
ncbi:glycoside hydrolase family 13 protein [Sphaerulina musiva SO2202]|uniref:Glycoside hydrolase family 13 protein n=1 Tax=Sphaerulina musiva (strain SO2202) TaxID=692275 RepID=N1QMN9_SPHMS|nr:glycoside hydrolase family 13 protein [Sphaerulina musiva SO2202]EMF16754.1 glycoside hydrolase family 13 protein [Sphaerulina musiva SO2202]